MKFRSFISSCLIACAALMATLLPTTASAKQCIWNKGGYVMSVSWFRPIDLATLYHTSRPNDQEHRVLRNFGPPVFTQSFGAGTGSCNETNEELVAFISVAGCLGLRIDPSIVWPMSCLSIEPRYVALHPNVKTATKERLPGQVIHVGCGQGTAGLCYVSTRRELAMTPPLPDSLVFVVMPSTTHYLDFWGSTFDVQWGQGGAIR